MRRVLITGGAPRIPVDAVRFLSVNASGKTAQILAGGLYAAGITTDLLLSIDSVDQAALAPSATGGTPPTIIRYTTRSDLDQAVQAWLAQYPDGVVVMTAAVNDYQTTNVTTVSGSDTPGEQTWAVGSKVPSRATEVLIRLQPAPKLIDQLPAWGHRGPLVACKYQATDGLITAAQSLLNRSSAAVVLANSLDGQVQALVDQAGVHQAVDREQVLKQLGQRIAELARS